jgi:hypothetical protein
MSTVIAATDLQLGTNVAGPASTHVGSSFEANARGRSAVMPVVVPLRGA